MKNLAVKETATAVEQATYQLARLLVDPGDEVVVTVEHMSAGMHVLVTTNAPRYIIGQQGSTIAALRQLMNKVASRLRLQIILEVAEKPRS